MVRRLNKRDNEHGPAMVCTCKADPTTYARVAMLELPQQLFIGGEWVAAAAGGMFEVHDPGTGELLGRVAPRHVAQRS